jgi:hypothetical protein
MQVFGRTGMNRLRGRSRNIVLDTVFYFLLDWLEARRWRA